MNDYQLKRAAEDRERWHRVFSGCTIFAELLLIRIRIPQTMYAFFPLLLIVGLLVNDISIIIHIISEDDNIHMSKINEHAQSISFFLDMFTLFNLSSRYHISHQVDE